METKGVRDVNQKDNRLGQMRNNYQGCLMKIVEYNASRDIFVEFQDNYFAKVHTQYYNFKKGQVKNPYYPSIYGVGIIGNKCPIKMGNKHTKEYTAWHAMLGRCYDYKFKMNRPTYKNVTCCEEWLLYENFYEWLHKQENFDKWLNGAGWAVDKDILVKGNRIYSPDSCCLVPKVVNSLFIKSDKRRGNLPIGVSYSEQNKAYMLSISRKLYDYPVMYFKDINNAFEAYKKYKEDIIKQMAEKEFYAKNITEPCYRAMISYEVEITD